MRKIRLFMMVSLDGYFEGPNHDISWHTVDDEFNEFAIAQMKEAGTIFFGRLTYQLFESFWPKAEADPSTTKDNREIANLINHMEKYVFSTTLKEVKEQEYWKNVHLMNKVDKEEIMRIKGMPGKDIWIGGSSDLTVSLIRLNLLDEIRVMVSPTIIGAGKPFLHGLDGRLRLKLLGTREFKSGNVLLTYRPEQFPAQ